MRLPESLPEPYLQVRLRHPIGALQLDLSFTTSARWTLLFGPSGSGKSTVLRAIAGLERPLLGKIVCGQRIVLDTAKDVWMQAHRRGVRWAAQTARLFPLMTVRENLGFGQVSEERVRAAIEHFQLDDLAGKRPAELSGGERQRVAVIRAAISPCRLLLLDEPFTGLDGRLRDHLIERLRAWLGDTPVLSVTHDVGEAFLLNAEVIRMAEGRIVAQGPVAEVLDEERTRLRAVLSSPNASGQVPAPD